MEVRKLNRSRLTAFLAFGVALVGFSACFSTPGKISLERFLAANPANNFKNYHFDSASRLVDRVAKAPDFLIRYLGNMDHAEDYSAYLPSSKELDELQRYINLLPKSYLLTLQQRLVGIYFINNYIGSGMADFVLDSNRAIYTILIVNPETMRHGISEWLTYRENSCFMKNVTSASSVRISVDCGSQYSALAYVLPHETSHIMDYVHHHTPYVERVLRDSGLSKMADPFQKHVWDSLNVPVRNADFPLREDITFYGFRNGPKIPLSQASKLYNGLMKSPFVSLYGSTDSGEDFAEYCTWWYFTTELGQPYRIILTINGKTEMMYEPMKLKHISDRLQSLSIQLSRSGE